MTQPIVNSIDSTSTLDTFRVSSAPATISRSAAAVSVLHVINGEHFSGAERVQQVLGHRLGDFGVYSEFACLKEGKFPKYAGINLRRIHNIRMARRYDFSALQRLLDIAQRGNFDLLHAHTPRSAMLTAAVSNRLQIPWVYHVHSPAARDSTRWLINNINHWLEKFCQRNCDKLITVSKSLRRELLRQGKPRQKVVAVANGVAELPVIDPNKRRNQSFWRLGIVALFRPRKGLECLLEAISKIDPTDRDIVLDVIGGFETIDYEQRIHRIVRELKLESRVNFTGFTNDIGTAIGKLDAMVLPSLFGEGMPMVVLEALSCGVPVIATKVEGTPEVIRDHVEGVLAEPRDPESLCSAIMEFTSDRSEWIEMSRRALQRHRTQFSDRRMAERIAKVYKRLLSETN